MRRLLVILASVAMVAVAGGRLANAGEVKGPPNQLNNTNETGALQHANSACAASGLNDFDLSDPDGQILSQVQTAHDATKYYGLQPGVQGRGQIEFGIDSGLCKGGTGQK